ncbi:MAG TPA: hypothetical protein VE754_03715 [Actinomycetota bacterium]|jgi:hypothetical protein|nr:hypothetical protein [Actinomycetota bacterium]
MRSGRRFASTVLISGALLLASCGEEGAPVSGDGANGASEETTEDRKEVALPAGGPTDPMFPADDDAYDLLAAGQCQELKEAAERWPPDVAAQHGADAVELYRSAAHVCLGEWDPAIEAFDRIGTPELKGICPREAVYAWLQPLIQAKKADPGFEPEFVASGGSPPCPTNADGDDGDDGEPTVGPTVES